MARSHYDDLHVTRFADVMVAVSDAKTVLVEPVRPRPCVLARMMEFVDPAACVEAKVRELGMFTCRRKLSRSTTWVPFGASEMVMRARRSGVIDGAVLACDGIGTIVCPTPELMQGVGARMNGLFHTTRYSSLVRRAAGLGGLVPASETLLDPVAGLRLAFSAGMRNLAVTVAGADVDVIPSLRKVAEELGIRCVILSVCNTGISLEESMLARKADIIWACAVEPVLLEAVRGRTLLQAGLKSPVFALSDAGVDLVLAPFGSSAAGVVREGRLLLGTGSEISGGEQLGSAGPVRIMMRHASRLPRVRSGRW